jgi:integrase
MAMGRKRTVNHALPPHMRVRKGRYYYDTQSKPRREIPLGADYGAALVKWAELEGKGLISSNTEPTFGMAWTRYKSDVLPGKAPRTQADNLEEAEHLLGVFRDAPLSQIEPFHVRGYMDRRGAKVRANREKALLSHVFNKAREWGYTKAPNPCAGVKGHREDGRDKYVEEAEYRAVYAQACIPIRNAMDLAYLTGQRPADVLKTTLQDVRDGFLWVTQGKTGAKLRIALEGLLGALVARLAHQPGKVASPYLIRNEDEQPLTYSAMSQRFQKARAAAIEHAQDSNQTALAASLRGFQFRDLRARAASDVDDLRAAQRLLGHGSAAMTEKYVRARVGDKVKGVK